MNRTWLVTRLFAPSLSEQLVFSRWNGWDF